MYQQTLVSKVRIVSWIIGLAMTICGSQIGWTKDADTVEPILTSGMTRSGGVVAHWKFSRNEDVDFDGWPEDWTRRKDRDHPAFVPVRIAAHDEAMFKLAQVADTRLLQSWPAIRQRVSRLPALPPSIADLLIGRYLRVELDGGWVAIQSPPVKVDPLYRYRLELSARTGSLVFDHAFAELVFLDAQGNTLAQHETHKLTGTTTWTKLNSDLVVVPKGSATVLARLIVRPIKSTGEVDIRGSAGFDDVIIRQLPQMQVVTDQRLAIYEPGARPQVTVRVLGLNSEAADMHFTLFDVYGRVIAERVSPFVRSDAPSATEPSSSPPAAGESSQTPARNASGPRSVVATTNSSAPTSTSSEPRGAPPIASEASATWELPELRPGFYTVRSLMGDVRKPWLETETTLAVLADLPAPMMPSPFGWSLPNLQNKEVDVKRLPDWLERLSVGVIKLPCWFAPDDNTSLDEAAWLVNRLYDKGIRTIGVLDQPPPSVLAKIDEKERREPYAVNFFRDPQVWQPLLEPVMTRLTLKVKTWQLGRDGDFSFLGRPQLKQAVRDIGRELQGFGQPIGLALAWPWLEPLPPVADQSWAATSFSSASPLSADELDAYLQTIEANQAPQRGRVETWVNVDPLEPKSYALDTRITDLVQRMAMVKSHSVQAAFVTKPTGPNTAILRSDWRPGELLVPWRTTATLIGDLTKVGQLPMPNGSSTIVLANDQRSVVIVWNPTPTVEQIFLGDSMRQIDVWGNVTTPIKQNVDGRPSHAVSIGPVPIFLVDVDPVLVAFRMSTRLVETNLDSLLGRRQTVSIEFMNPTRETISGEVRMQPKTDWEVDSRPQTFDLGVGRSAIHSFDVSLRNSAKIGDTALDFDFLLRTQPLRKFTVRRILYVGPTGLDVEVTTRLTGDEMLVLLTMINRSDRLQQYDCMLFPPTGRQYQRRQVIAPAGSTVKRLFTWPNGAELVGEKMLLRAIEQDGDRVLNRVIELRP